MSWDRATLSVLATGAFTLMPTATVTAPFFGVIGIASGLLALKAKNSVSTAQATRMGLVIVIGVIAVGLRSSAVQIPLADNLVSMVWTVAALSQVALLSARLFRPLSRPVVVISVLVSVTATILIGVRLINSVDGTDMTTDVVEMHKSALQVISESKNPYQFATALNSDVSAPEGELIVGYVYPPIAMAPIVVSTWLFGDPRWILLGSWVGFLGIVGWQVARYHPILLPIVPILSMFLPLRLTLFAGWTEPISLLLAGVVLLRAPWLRLLGLSAAGASKQHFLLAAPLLLAARFTQKSRLILGSVLLAALTLLPYLLMNSGQLGRALFGNLPPPRIRGDSYSIPTALKDLGLKSALLPRPIWLVLVAIAGVWIGRAVRGIGQLLIGSAVILAIAYVSSQGFVNYWLLVASLMALGAVATGQEEREID